MASTRSPYTDKWRAAIRGGVQSSASALVPILHEKFHPQTVIDIGCGEGWFLREFEHLGATTTGVDGSWVAGVTHVDLTAPPYPDLGRFELALCLEVAEHVHERHADQLVDWLTDLAPIVVFSAAVPGQGGTGHVNEQPPRYWAEKFAAHSYEGSGALRWQIWDDERVEPWYAQNLLVFGAHDLQRDGCPYVIHPGIWKCYR